MIVQVNHRIARPYAERLPVIKSLVLDEIVRRQEGIVNLKVYRKEKAYASVYLTNPPKHSCYSCLKPIRSLDDEVTFIELSSEGFAKTYLHLHCVNPKV